MYSVAFYSYAFFIEGIGEGENVKYACFFEVAHLLSGTECVHAYGREIEEYVSVFGYVCGLRICSERQGIKL